MALNIKPYVKRHSTIKSADGQYVDDELNKISDSLDTIATFAGPLTGIATGTFLGNISGSTANPVALTATEVTANLDVFDATNKGLTPAPTTSTGKLLKDDATWVDPDQIIATVGQLQFPASQNASSDVNNLDDYAEGTFTPELSFGGGTDGLTYTTQSGTYTKIGRLVFFECTITVNTTGSSTGDTKLTGLPFTIGGSVNPTFNLVTNNCDIDTTDEGSYYFSAQGEVGETYAHLLFAVGGGDEDLGEWFFVDGAILRVSGHYIV